MSVSLFVGKEDHMMSCCTLPLQCLTVLVCYVGRLVTEVL